MKEDTTKTENPGEEKIAGNLGTDTTPNREPQPETPSSSIKPQPLHCYAGPEKCEECRRAEEEKRRLDEEKRKAHESAQDTGQNGELEAQNASVSNEKKKEDQERTKIKKRLFLDALAKTLGSIGKAREMVEIGRRTYYDWMEEDPEFRKAVRQVNVEAIDDVKDIAINLVRKGHPPTVRWWLEKKTEEFKPRSAIEVTPGNTIVFEDMSTPQSDETNSERQVSPTLPTEGD